MTAPQRRLQCAGQQLVLFSILATACNKDAVSGEEDEAASGSSDDEDKDLDGWTIGDGDCDDIQLDQSRGGRHL